MTTEPREKEYRRFLLAFLCTDLIVLGLLWLWVIEKPMVYMDGEYPVWQAKMKLLHSERPASLVILGDSRGAADFIPKRIGPGVVNLALGGATPIEAYYAAEEFVSAPTPPQAVIVSFSPANLMRKDALSFEFWGRSVQFGYFQLGDLTEIRQRSRAINDDTLFGPKAPGDIDASLKILLNSIQFPPYYVPALLNAGFTDHSAKNQGLFEKVTASRGQITYGDAASSTGPDAEVGFKSFMPLPILDDYLDRTLALLNAHNIPVYFIGAPHNIASVQLYSPEIGTLFTSYINAFASKYPNFHRLGETMPVWPSDNFGDPAHLNIKGASTWSDQTAKLLGGSNSAGGPFGPN